VCTLFASAIFNFLKEIIFGFPLCATKLVQKLAIKHGILCLSSTLQQIEKFKFIRVVMTIDRRHN